MNILSSYEGKKREIIKVALELFATKGYDGVSVRDISKRAGVSEAALYKHFKGKEDLALYIFSTIITEYSTGLCKIKDEQCHTVHKLCRIVEFTYDLYSLHPAEIRFALLSQYCFWDHLPNEIKPHFILKTIFNEGIKAKEIPQEDAYFCIMIYSGVMLQPLAQYPYFADVLPEITVLGGDVIAVVRKLFAHK